MFMTEELQKKWSPVLDHPELASIADPYKKAVTALVLENQQQAMRQDARMLSETADGGPTNVTGAGIQNFDPILISLVRRSLPNLIAYDVAGVQPMTGPTGLIFAMRARYANQSGSEAFYNEANTIFSGQAQLVVHSVSQALHTLTILHLTLRQQLQAQTQLQLVLLYLQLLLNSWVQTQTQLSNKWHSLSRRLLLLLKAVH